MYRLTKEQEKDWASHHEKVITEQSAIEAAIEQFNKAVAAAQAALQPYVDDYNEAVNEAASFVATVAEDWRSKFDDASESWQESDKGQEVAEVIEGLEGFSPAEFQLPEPNEIDGPEDVADELLNIQPE